MRTCLSIELDDNWDPTYGQGFKDGAGGFYPRIFYERSTAVYHEGYQAGLAEWKAAVEAFLSRQAAPQYPTDPRLDP